MAMEHARLQKLNEEEVMRLKAEVETLLARAKSAEDGAAISEGRLSELRGTIQEDSKSTRLQVRGYYWQERGCQGWGG
jgi:hypothetical protein